MGPMKREDPPGVRFGAVYFRKTNPPRADWERDYRVAAADGHTLFRHWFPWNAIEVAPGRFDWADYDRHLDLGARHGIRTVIAEMSTDFPEWLRRMHPGARGERRDGSKRISEMHVSCVTGGHAALCLDHPPVARACRRYLTALARRYRRHPGLFGYDVWNECTLYHPDRLCYCPATRRAFVRWLAARYGTVKKVAEAWHRHSLASWADVEMPRQQGPFPDFLDLIRFFNDNAFGWMKWKVAVIRAADPDHPVCAHGNAKSFCDIAPACGDDFRAAEPVDIFGYTYWRANGCDPLLAGDLIRGAAAGKEFWRAEAVGGHDWQDRNTTLRPQPDKDRMEDPANVRLDCLISLVAGARAYQNPRWRPLLDGPLFGAYGWYGMDGSRTPRSAEMVGIIRWAGEADRRGLWRSNPVAGPVAILVLDEAQANCYARHGTTDFYSACVKGAWQAFRDAGIQCDFVKPGRIGDRALVYAPYPVALDNAVLRLISGWVRTGGNLVSEACFGYFNEYGHAGPRWHDRGIGELFGCREGDTAFAPDRAQTWAVKTGGGNLLASLYRQSYIPATGTVLGRDSVGEPALVRNRFGRGTATIVGGMPGYAYAFRPTAGSRDWFAGLTDAPGRRPPVMVSPGPVVPRLWDGPGGVFLWLVNTGTATARAAVTPAPGAAGFRKAEPVRHGRDARISRGWLAVRVPGRDAVILKLS